MNSGANYGFLIRDANEGQDAEQQYNSREKAPTRRSSSSSSRPLPSRPDRRGSNPR